jgi:hypothetical protein
MFAIMPPLFLGDVGEVMFFVKVVVKTFLWPMSACSSSGWARAYQAMQLVVDHQRRIIAAVWQLDPFVENAEFFKVICLNV